MNVGGRHRLEKTERVKGLLDQEKRVSVMFILITKEDEYTLYSNVTIDVVPSVTNEKSMVKH